MAKKRTRRQRLKRDPANQRIQKVKAWALTPGRHYQGREVLGVGISLLLQVPRIVLGLSPRDKALAAKAQEQTTP